MMLFHHWNHQERSEKLLESVLRGSGGGVGGGTCGTKRFWLWPVQFSFVIWYFEDGKYSWVDWPETKWRPCRSAEDWIDTRIPAEPPELKVYTHGDEVREKLKMLKREYEKRLKTIWTFLLFSVINHVEVKTRVGHRNLLVPDREVLGTKSIWYWWKGMWRSFTGHSNSITNELTC